MKRQTCREAILEVAPTDRAFTADEVVQRLRARGAPFPRVNDSNTHHLSYVRKLSRQSRRYLPRSDKGRAGLVSHPRVGAKRSEQLAVM